MSCSSVCCHALSFSLLCRPSSLFQYRVLYIRAREGGYSLEGTDEIHEHGVHAVMDENTLKVTMYLRDVQLLFLLHIRGCIKFTIKCLRLNVKVYHYVLEKHYRAALDLP